ncbi:hypothetical protein [Trichormus azollae]|uniref:hypothetical protein n=1 Tax=Trichormus azollae TaxID=1164 RepID=UPI00325F441A
MEFVETFSNPILLLILKEKFSSDELLLFRPGNRLSVMPVSSQVPNKILPISFVTS